MDFDDLLPGTNVCDVSDACDRLGVPAARSGWIRPVYPGCPPIVGAVSTVTLSAGTGAALDVLVDAFIEDARDVVLVDLGGRVDVQCWGTLLATAATLCGVGAAVVNGAVRDVSGLAELAFPTYGRGVHPAGMAGRLAISATGEDVAIDGIPVAVGWIVVADMNGAVFLPPERADAVFETARSIANAERQLLMRVRAAASTADALKTLRGEPSSSRHRAVDSRV